MDKFTKGCLAIIAVSLSILAGTSVYHTSVGISQPAQLQERAIAERKANVAAEAKEALNNCKQEQAELTVVLRTLNEQIQKVPATIQTVHESVRNDGKDPSKATPNRLYEQLMYNIITTTTKLEATKVRCGS